MKQPGPQGTHKSPIYLIPVQLSRALGLAMFPVVSHHADPIHAGLSVRRGEVCASKHT